MPSDTAGALAGPVVNATGIGPGQPIRQQAAAKPDAIPAAAAAPATEQAAEAASLPVAEPPRLQPAAAPPLLAEQLALVPYVPQPAATAQELTRTEPPTSLPPAPLPMHLQHAVHRALSDLQAMRLLASVDTGGRTKKTNNQRSRAQGSSVSP